MPGRRLLELLDEIPDTGEIVIRMPSAPAGDELLEAWRSARAEANAALERWRVVHTRDAFAAFRAAEDRADAAQDALAARHIG
jgi:hypothetical protein